MDNKEKIKKALLEFASTLSNTDKNVRDAQKKNIVSTLSEEKKTPTKKRKKAKTGEEPLNDQLTNLLSQYTESLGSTNKKHREQTKKQVMDLVNDQIHVDHKQEDAKQFKQYIDDIETMFNPHGTKKDSKKPIIAEDLQKYIDDKVGEINQKVQQIKESAEHAMASNPSPDGESGGGSNAQQFKEGGKIEGNIQITGEQRDPNDIIDPDTQDLAGGPALVIKQPVADAPIVKFVNVDAQTGEDLPGGLLIDPDGNLIIPGDVTVGGTFTSEQISISPGTGGEGGVTDEDLIPKADLVYKLGTTGASYKSLNVGSVSAADCDLYGGLISNTVTTNTISAERVTSHLIPAIPGLKLGDCHEFPWETLCVNSLTAMEDMYIKDDVIIGDDTLIHGDLRVSGNIYGVAPGGSTAYGNTVSGNYLRITTNSQLSGNVELGKDGFDNISFSGNVDTDILPQDGDESLGSNSNQWNTLYVSDANVANDLSVLGNTIVGATADDTLNVRSEISSDLVPVTGADKNIGSTTNNWGTVYTTHVQAASSVVVDDNLTVGGDTALSGNLTVKGDLRVYGNAYLSAGDDKYIYVGDGDQDNVVFRADIDSNILPNLNKTYTVGSSTKQWATIYSQDLSASRNLSVSGDTHLGTSNFDKLAINADITTNIRPDVTGLDLGNTVQPWYTLHVQNVSATDNLSVSGDSVLGDSSTDRLTINSRITSDLTPYVSQQANLGSPGSVWGTTHTTFVSALSDVNINRDLIVVRDATIDNNLHVSGTSTLSGAVSAADDLHVAKNAYIQNDLQVLGSSVLSGDVHIQGDLRVDGNTYLSAGSTGTIYVGDSDKDNVVFTADVDSNIVPDKTKTHNLGSSTQEWNTIYVDTLTASTDVNIGNNLNVDNNTVLGSNISQDIVTFKSKINTPVLPNQDITHNLGDSGGRWNTLYVQDVSAYGNVKIDGDTFIGDTWLDTVSVSAQVDSGIIPVSGELHDLGSSINRWRKINTRDVDVSNNANIQNNLQVGGSSSLTGNVSANSNLFVQGQLLVSDSSTLSGAVLIQDTLTVEQATTLENNLAVSGTSILAGDVTTQDNLTVQDNLVVSGTSMLKDDITAGHDLTVQNNLAVSGSSTLNDVTVGKNLVVSGTSMLIDHVTTDNDLTVGGNFSVSGTSVLIDSVTAQTDLTVQNDLQVLGSSVLSGDVHIRGDLRVDGNAFLSAGSDGTIYVGDTDQDNVVFTADIDSDFYPDKTQTYNLGSSSKQWNLVYTHDLSASGNAHVQHNTIFGTSSADWVRPLGRIDNHLIPRYNDIYNLGRVDRRWDVIYVSTARVKDDLVVEDDASILGDVTLGASDTSNIFINGLMNTNFVPEFGTTLQAYTTSASGYAPGTLVGGVANLFTPDKNLVWGISNPVGIFSMDLTIDLDIPIPGGIDEFVFHYTTNSPNGTREVQVHDRLTNTWVSMYKDTPNFSTGNIEVQQTLGPAFTAMHIDGFRFEYDNTLTTSEDFQIHYFVVKKDGNIIDWRDIQFDSGFSLGINNKPWGSAYIVDGNILQNLDVAGNTVIGTNNFDTVVFNADVLSNIEPDQTDTYNLGNPLQQWKNTYTTSLTAAYLSAGGLTYPTQDGEKRDVLTTDGEGNLSFGSPQRVVMDVRNDDVVTLAPGDPVYAVGEIGASGVIRVRRSHANDPATMPAIGLIRESIPTNSDGEIITNGVFNTNINGFTGAQPGDTLYVAATGLTLTKPSGSQLIQNIGQVLKTNGSIIQGIKVSSIDRTNDVPNLSADHIFYGEGGYSVQKTLTDAIYQQPVINTQTIDATKILSGGEDLMIGMKTKEQRINGLYNYLVSDYTTNHTVSSTSITNFIDSSEYSVLSSSMDIGDTITLSATSDQYVLSNTTGNIDDDWIYVTLKPDTIIVDNDLSNQKTVDSFLLSQFKSAKYTIEVYDTSSNEVFFTELSLVTNGVDYTINEYGLNYTTSNPFVEFDAVVATGSVSLRILQANGFNNITNCRLKAKRTCF